MKLRDWDEEVLDAEDQARARRNRERDERPVKSGRNQRRLRKQNRERKAARDVD